MAVNHRVVINGGSLPFVAYPIQISTTANLVINYDVASTGGIVRSSGNRIYDTSVLPASGSVLAQANVPLVFPFITTQLPSTYFDAVLLLSINGKRYIQGFSNSPDNVAGYTSNYFLEDKKMFGVFLKCYGTSLQPGNYDTANHYMFGGEGLQQNSPCDLKMVFDAPTLAPVTITPKVTFYSATDVSPTLVRPSEVIPTGSIQFTFTTFYLFNEFSAIGYTTIYKAGYFKLEFVSSDPSYVSILPFYHFGQFG